MVSIKPFRGYRPRPDLVTRVISPPYDVVSSEEARKLAAGNPISFLHVVRAEIDLPPETDPYDGRVYESAASNLRGLIEEGVLVREAAPAFYVYQQRMGEHCQAGLVVGASAAEYDRDLIKKHEQTRKAKEADRTRHIEATGANTGPVFLCYRQSAVIDRLVEVIRGGEAECDVTTEDGVAHTLWAVTDPEQVAELARAFREVPALYIADGHHRAASSVAVCRRRGEEREGGEEAPWNHFLAVAFPHDQLKVMGYHRVVADLNGHSPARFRELLAEKFTLVPDAPAEPREKGSFGLFLEGRWYNLVVKEGGIDRQDPVAGLDCSILQEQVLAPLLGITDPRADERIDFVGGIRGTAELERRCRQGWAAAFALHPTGVEELMAVADASRLMPPKSTWFEPKLRSGLVVRKIDEI